MFVSQSRHRPAQFIAQFPLVVTTDIAQFAVFQIVPDPFHRVAIRGIGRQAFQPDALAGRARQELLDGPPPVDRRPVPDHQQLPWYVRQQMPQEGHTVGATERPVLHLLQQAPVRGQGAADRQMVARQGHGQDRGLPAGGVGAHRPGRQVKAGLVYPDEGAPFAGRFFLSAGRRSSVHVRMAAASRWAARVMGFCTDQPSWRSRRLTCAG
jgi:hypothetical protein